MEKERIAVAREIIRRQNVGEVLRDKGISDIDFIRWLEEGEAAEYLYRMSKVKAMAKMPELWLELEQLAEEGDVKAIKLYFDLCCQGEKGGCTPLDTFINPEVEAARREVFGDEQC